MSSIQTWNAVADGPTAFTTPADASKGVAETLEDLCICDLAAAESAWRHLEGRASITPYQRYDWCKALVESGVERASIAVAIVGAPSRPLVILPLAIERKWGLTYARLLGSEVGNADALICAPEVLSSFDAQLLTDTLSNVSAAVGGLDIVSFRSLTASQGGVANPLVLLGAQPGPSQMYSARIGSIERPFLEHGVNAKLRGNFKRGTRRLEELYGPVALKRIVDPDSFRAVHDTFVAQRGERFDKMGVTNIFAEPAMKRFFALACLPGFSDKAPALVCHALFAGDTIVATSFGAQTTSHYSQYINSTSSGPASKYSLMGILVSLMMDELIADGVTMFDMGLGDFPYKTDWTQPETVYDAVIPLSGPGWVGVNFMRAAIRAKRTIKQDPKLWSLATSARRALCKIRRAPSSGAPRDE